MAQKVNLGAVHLEVHEVAEWKIFESVQECANGDGNLRQAVFAIRVQRVLAKRCQEQSG